MHEGRAEFGLPIQIHCAVAGNYGLDNLIHIFKVTISIVMWFRVFLSKLLHVFPSFCGSVYSCALTVSVSHHKLRNQKAI